MSSKESWVGSISGSQRGPPRGSSKLNTKCNGILSPSRNGLYPSSKVMGSKWLPQNTYLEGWQRTRAVNFAGAQ
eukprot:47593-Pelagomonas_calceolata.AAC.1